MTNLEKYLWFILCICQEKKAAFIPDASIGVFRRKNYNREIKYLDKLSGLFLVASDVIGGLYAININKFSDNRNMIWYFAPDTLEWECIKMMYNEFVAWCLQGNTDEFYSMMRWQNWKNEVKNTTINSAILIYPFLWAKECDVETSGKKIVNLDEIIELNFEYCDILNG